MRPLEVEIAGFRSHLEPTLVNFEKRRLLAITGPIGAGKSSILDAICFALYRKTPKIQREQKRLICSRADAARVRLRFAVDGSVYEITRTLPRRGNGEHLLVDLATGSKVVGAADVTDKVEDLLGLNFEAFRSSILLAQGQFDQFLHATPDERTKILKGVFRFDQIGALHAAAKARAGELRSKLERIEGELQGLPADLDERLVHERDVLGSINASVAAMERGVEDERRVESERTSALARGEAATARGAALQRALRDVPDEHDLARLAERAGAVAEAVRAAGEKAAAADEELRLAQSALGELEQRVGTEVVLQGALERCVHLVEAQAEAASEQAHVLDSAVEAGKAAGEVEAAEAAEAAARAAVQEAAERLRAAERADMAHALRGHLVAGEPCPVCEQTVGAVPPPADHPELDELRARLAQAEKGLAGATRAASAARETAVRLQAEEKSAKAALDKASARHDALRAQLEELLGPHDDPSGEVRERLERLRVSQEAVRVAAVSVERARSEAERAAQEVVAVEREQRNFAALLIRVADVAATAAPDIDCSADALVECAGKARVALDKALGEARAEADSAAADAERAATSLRVLREGLGLGEGERVEVALAAARQRALHSRERIKDLEDKRERVVALRAEAETLAATRALYARLADDFRDTNFVNFLLEDRRRLLSELGSERLLDMTGRYRFSDDAEFDIIDEMDAEKRRDVETLSGGETFLASLALALALAEAVTREGGRLESFFLDEGFGSLDAEAFDHALDGIERIVIGDRVIALVSHIPALSQRVEDKIELERTPEGLTRVVAGAS